MGFHTEKRASFHPPPPLTTSSAFLSSVLKVTKFQFLPKRETKVKKTQERSYAKLVPTPSLLQ